MIVTEHNPVSAVADRRFGRIVFGLIVVGFLAVMAAGVGALLVMLRGAEHTRWVNHTYLVERHVSGIRLSLEEMRSARRGRLLLLRSDSGLSYDEAARHLAKEIASVAALTRDNAYQQGNVARLRSAAEVLDRLFRQSLHERAGQVHGEERNQQAAQRLEALADRMLTEERVLLAERGAAQAASLRTFYAVLGGAGVLLILVAASSILVIMRYTRDLAATRDQLTHLNANLEKAVGVRTRDLQRANEEIQRFAYIVSHDLRAPLVNVMGFTSELEVAIRLLAALIDGVGAENPDLITDDARVAIEEDLPEAVGFIRSSTQKMDRLINAILQLSREGRRNIAPVRIDTTNTVERIIDGIRTVVDDAGATIDVQREMPELVTDQLAFEQIVSNIIENALKYLQPGRPGMIGVTAERQQGRIAIAIADNGRGIDPKDHQRIFDLFRRSGAQDRPGEGIGLAHVRTLAYRLGGTISVSSEPGTGSTFTIDLPAEYAGEKAGST